MLIDLTCPVEIFRTAIPTADTHALSLTMFNLSDRVIVSAEVTARLLTASGLEKEKMVFRGRAPFHVPDERSHGLFRRRAQRGSHR